MLRRRQQPEAPAITFMDPELILPFEDEQRDSYSFAETFAVKAVLFATGELKRLDTKAEVYGLVLAGYDGLNFGDDGTFTGHLVSELPLEDTGIRVAESAINEALKQRDPRYVAEFVGRISAAEAAAMLAYETKRAHRVETPHQVNWEGGTLSGGVQTTL